MHDSYAGGNSSRSTVASWKRNFLDFIKSNHAGPGENTKLSICQVDEFSDIINAGLVNTFPLCQLIIGCKCFYDELVGVWMQYDPSDRSIPELRSWIGLRSSSDWCLSRQFLSSCLTICVILQSNSSWPCVPLMPFGWSLLESLWITSLNMSLGIYFCIFSGRYSAGGYWWWWLLTGIIRSPTMFILQSISSSPHLYSYSFVTSYSNRYVLLIFWLVLIVNTSSSSDNSQSSFCLSYATYGNSVYISDYARSLGAQPFQTMPAVETVVLTMRRSMVLIAIGG